MKFRDLEYIQETAALEAASMNFGRVARLSPFGVATPSSTDGVIEAVSYAREKGLKVVARGAGHSQGSQGLTSGLVLSTRRLTGVQEVDAPNRRIVVGAGASWADVVKAAKEEGMMPPVLTDHPTVTVGGTLSVAGLGPASFARGSQAHHVTGFELVLADGNAIWVSPDSNGRLFAGVLGGLGRFGIMTRAELSLVDGARCVNTTVAAFGDLDGFVAALGRLYDQNPLGDSEHFLVEGFAQPDRQRGSGHVFVLECGMFSDAEGAFGDELATCLAGGKVVSTKCWGTSEYTFRLDETFERYRDAAATGAAHPWVEHFLPLTSVKPYLESILPAFGQTPVLVWPVRKSTLGRRGFPLPDAEQLVLVGIMARLEGDSFESGLDALRNANAYGLSLGGKRYISGWLEFDHDDWQSHYGDEWESLSRLKAQHDPEGLFEGLTKNDEPSL